VQAQILDLIRDLQSEFNSAVIIITTTSASSPSWPTTSR
jgi:ABC-type dipeptide/oligopeptide/nickel transport system ATPase component